MMNVYLEANWGSVVADEGYIYFLTGCCRASAKGSMGATVCRSCYEEIPTLFGMGMRCTDEFATRDLASYIAELEGVRQERRHLLTAAHIVSKEASRMRHPSRSGGRIPTA